MVECSGHIQMWSDGGSERERASERTKSDMWTQRTIGCWRRGPGNDGYCRMCIDLRCVARQEGSGSEQLGEGTAGIREGRCKCGGRIRYGRDETDAATVDSSWLP
jgi:hypothetical protein